MDRNSNLKQYFRSSGVYQWQIAEALGVHDVTFNRWLRYDLSPAKRRAIIEAVERIKKENEAQE